MSDVEMFHSGKRQIIPVMKQIEMYRLRMRKSKQKVLRIFAAT
ncbi:hypothetical protein HMPREF1146_2063 [Prevotella sp. MSX73]|uniref:Uncharacterized protein n=1 Tax=Segatella buccae ATCC 33574 TaxID=873513 RepID=E6K4G1_9BACT|nr:hypothetical protein HMPREF6485_0463 [Segatella buccae ATCC 33574]EJP31450.1 hypothetical protein HMPREF1146_2063 [Prevotella sp. MSX73]